MCVVQNCLDSISKELLVCFCPFNTSTPPLVEDLGFNPFLFSFLSGLMCKIDLSFYPDVALDDVAIVYAFEIKTFPVQYFTFLVLIFPLMFDV